MYTNIKMSEYSKKENEVKNAMVDIINGSPAPLSTEDITKSVKRFGQSREQVLRKLRDLRGDRQINGKRLGPARGVWVWWKI